MYCGVRRDCLLARLISVFAGQALLCHPKSRGIRVDLAYMSFTATQCADDVAPLRLLPDSGWHRRDGRFGLMPLGAVCNEPRLTDLFGARRALVGSL